MADVQSSAPACSTCGPFLMLLCPLIFIFSCFCILMCVFPAGHLPHLQLQSMTEVTGDCECGLTVHVSCSSTVRGALLAGYRQKSEALLFPCRDLEDMNQVTVQIELFNESCPSHHYGSVEGDTPLFQSVKKWNDDNWIWYITMYDGKTVLPC